MLNANWCSTHPFSENKNLKLRPITYYGSDLCMYICCPQPWARTCEYDAQAATVLVNGMVLLTSGNSITHLSNDAFDIY